MTKRRIIIGAVAAAALAGAAGGAVAASSGGRDAEKQILEGTAERLGVTESELRSALTAELDEQLDAAVTRGDLTQEQADAIKERRKDSGSVLGPGPGGHGHPGGPGFGPRQGFGPGGPGGPGFLKDAAEALDLTVEQLLNRLRDGRSIAQIAKAQGTTVAKVKAAVEAAATERLDDAVAAGDLTKAQRDDILEHIDRLGDAHDFPGPPPFGGRFHHRP